MGDSCAAAEASVLSTYRFDGFKKEDFETNIKVSAFDQDSSWERGKILGGCQNYARYLSDLPGNHLTPTIFANELKQKFSEYSDNLVVDVKVRNLDWIKERGMSLFLGVSQGSEEEPKFVEIQYRPRNPDPTMDSVLLVGKGITFDSGGISIKPSAGMASMKGDMGGAAVVASSLLGAAHLAIPRTITAVIPMCENMPSGKAYKPGDVLTAINGKSVEIDNTDAEGRLILADALHYGKSQVYLNHF